MRLKKIRLAGFKSFVDPTNIPFPGDMTAIVGPNGCGKSNVIDAVRWVLGESSAKNLRGDAMTDVIFNGSSARKPVGQCSVELVFDNSSNRIQGEFAAFNEISVKRLVTKDAVSSYFLNNAKCRRKDITDLFLGTGLGPRSYAIIEQGMISKLIESKPQELRVFIEEAAGISKYKERRRETQNRISHTKENLDRLEDVRQELGDQIAKLKRQASAATRYKELKQEERKLKTELASIRWLVQSKIMAESQAQIKDLQQDLENLVLNKQGDQSGLQDYKNQQAICKQKIDDLQKQIFSLGTEITKLEQSQLFAKKRASQIQSETEQLKQSESALKQSLQTIQLELRQSEALLVDAEPERDMLQEQLEELEQNKFDTEDKLQACQNMHKQHEDAYYQKTRELQQKHSQVQQTLSLQERSEMRINSIKDELSEFSASDLHKEKSDLLAELKENAILLSQINQQHSELEQAVSAAKKNLLASEREHQAQNNEYNKLHAKLQALLDIQASYERGKQSNTKVSVDELNNILVAKAQKELCPVWEYFSVEQGTEQMFESAFSRLGAAMVVETSLDTDILDKTELEAWQDLTNSLLFSQNFSQVKKPQTLASLVKNEYVPSFLNEYIVLNDKQGLGRAISSLQNDEKLVLADGCIFGASYFQLNVTQEKRFLRANEIKDIQAQVKALESVLSDVSLHKQKCEKTLEHQQLAFDECAAQQQKHSILAKEYSLLLNNIEQRLQDSNTRKQRLENELAEQKDLLEQEQMSLEMFNEQIEELSEQVLELEDRRLSSSQTSESLRQEVNSTQAQFSHLQNKLHEQAMQLQQIRNSIKILQEQSSSKQSQLNDNLEKLALLQAEAEDLLMPEQDQEEKLQNLLEKQGLVRNELQDKQNTLSEIDDGISDIEKGQMGLNSQIDKIKEQIQSHQITLESAHVRAQAFVEQLGELKESIKDILERLDENADESKWQNDLDKTTQALNRLGAVNLAAVEEYEEQSQRKEHLDAQNLDLSQALETLENAMRKIDKETRARFKNTFDQVNSDLKQLFPKVFGGGMAYLDLTDDDMLDTGVTIMARPPGKKNSTIHLLSGGEKALTALSLVFAIFSLNPAPFCLLDEVDAPLDDANVGRFCRLVSQMSESVQFIYITHNKVAMEMATHLTGVTMAEPGVSRMVAVDMEQALAIAE